MPHLHRDRPDPLPRLPGPALDPTMPHLHRDWACACAATCMRVCVCAVHARECARACVHGIWMRARRYTLPNGAAAASVSPHNARTVQPSAEYYADLDALLAAHLLQARPRAVRRACARAPSARPARWNACVCRRVPRRVRAFACFRVILVLSRDFASRAATLSRRFPRATCVGPCGACGVVQREHRAGADAPMRACICACVRA